MAKLSTPVTLLERPQQASQALLMGDMDGAWRSMLTPQTLTPAQRDQLAKKLKLDEGPFAPLFRGLTNPVLIGSIILSYKFPVPTADQIFKVSQKVNGLTGKLPLLGRLASKDSIFRGTSVPEDLDLIQGYILEFKSKYGAQWSEALDRFGSATGHLPTQKEQVLVGAWLDGLHKNVRGFGGKKGVVRIGSGSTAVELPGVQALFPNLEQRMGAPLLRLAQDMRQSLDTVWEEVFSNVENRKRILQALSRQRKAGFYDDFTGVAEEILRNPRKMPDYFPHRIIKSEQDFAELIKRLTAGSSRSHQKAAQAKAVSWASPETMKRKYAMLPSAQDLSLVSEFVDPIQVQRAEAITKARILNSARKAGVRETIIGKMQAEPLSDLLENYPKYMPKGEAELFAGAILKRQPAQYGLRAMEVLNSYTHTLAGTYAWTVKGMGEKMMRSLDELKAAGATGNAYAKIRQDMLESTYIPMAMGRTEFRQALRAQAWQQSMAELSATIDQPALRKLLGDDLLGTVKGHLENSRGAFNLAGLGRKTAGYFYASTLGLNVGSAITNMSQNVLTLAPMVGPTAALKGFGETLRKAHKYFALRFGPRQLKHEDAVGEAYPLFRQAGLATAPLTDEIISNTLANAAGIQGLPAQGITISERISRAMMTLFSSSETVNRIGAFEAGLIHARRTGLGADDAIRFAGELTKRSHFVAGPTAGPYAFLGTSPLIRQFAYFPTRMLDFATSHAFTLGSAEKNFMGYNPGTFARMIAGSVIAMELGDVMGTDLRSRLLSSALPTFQASKEGSVFGAFPIVPPFFQITGAAGVGAATGEWKEFLHSTPLLIPGGIQALKVAGYMPPQMPGSSMGQRAAQLFSRSYADYAQPAPDGRIAVYSGKGTFRGYYTPWDLFKQGAGIRGGDLDKEGQMLQMISRHREEITQARRNYMEAHFKNDKRKAEQINRNFKKRWGFDLPVNENDMKAMQTRRTVTRLEQLIRTTPAGPMREGLIEAVSATIGGASSALLGVDPQLLGQPRPEAEAGRFGAEAPGPAGTRQRFDARRDLSPNRELDPQRIGRQPGMTNLQPVP